MPTSPVDALLPAEMAEKAEKVGVAKADLSWLRTVMLGVLAGAFIALGAVFATTTVAGSTLSFGVTKLLAGVVFSVGLILVVIGGAELFTGNNLIVMAWANKRVSTAKLLRNWGLVFLGNTIGALGTAALVFLGEHHMMGGAQVGATALAIADAKCQLGFVQAVALGVLCNTLVCLAVWMTFSARSAVDKVAVIVPPIAAFVAAGFEHSIANLFFVPSALLIKWGASDAFWQQLGKTPADYPELTASGFLVNNLLPVTLGNILGGGVLVALVYWAIYLRGSNRVA